MSFFRYPYARVLTLVLLAQAGLYYGLAARTEHVPVIAPLSTFPYLSNGWRTVQELPLEKDVQDVLKADDTLNRVYVDPSGSRQAGLFIAFFKTQRSGQAPHSPKNCLPGSGWAPVESGVISIAVPGRSEPIVTNKYVVQLGDEKDIVLYWYQSHQRIIASEYSAKLWLVMDAIRYHHSDTALVRVWLPASDGNTDRALRAGVQFIQAIFPDIQKHLPS